MHSPENMSIFHNFVKTLQDKRTPSWQLEDTELHITDSEENTDTPYCFLSGQMGTFLSLDTDVHGIPLDLRAYHSRSLLTDSVFPIPNAK
jgi:hypothetical protein